MGYRQYIYSIDRSLANEIRACKTEKEFVNLIMQRNPAAVYYDPIEDAAYIGLSNLGNELFEFGKYYENSDEMYKHGDSLFSSEELRELYEDYGAIVLEPDGLLCAIKWQRQHVIEMYEDLLREKSKNDWDSRPQIDRLIENAKDYLAWWKYGDGPADLNLNRSRLASSWLYEHTYFDLVRIYKTFDWDNQSIIFLGW